MALTCSVSMGRCVSSFAKAGFWHGGQGRPGCRLASPHMSNTVGAHRRYWRHTLQISAGLLALWLAVTLGVGLFGPSMAFDFFGWPFGFWATAQGALFVYCAIVWIYAWAMNRLDKAAGDPSDD